MSFSPENPATEMILRKKLVESDSFLFTWQRQELSGLEKSFSDRNLTYPLNGWSDILFYLIKHFFFN